MDLLNSLLISTIGLSADDIEKMARELYKDLYLLPDKNYGVMKTHDNEDVYFWEDRFDHAFYSTKDKPQSNSIAKNKLAIDRIERIKWIKELISGRIPNSECWEINQAVRKSGRLYIAKSVFYMVWLESRDSGGFKFSSAYPAQAHNVREKCRGNTRIWTK